MQHDDAGHNGANAPFEVVQVVRTPEKGVLVVRFLGATESICTHWKGSKSFACTGEDSCPPNVHRERIVWKGYAPIEWGRVNPVPAWVPGVLEITEGLDEYLGDDNLRGQVWELTRGGLPGGRHECRGRLIRHEDPRLCAPNAIDVRAVVKRLYRNMWVRFEQPKPFGCRQRLPVTLIAQQESSEVPDEHALSPQEQAAALRKQLARLEAERAAKLRREGKNDA